MNQIYDGKLMDGDYLSPSIKLLNVLSEGLLCQSSNLQITDWELDNESLDF